MKKSVAGKRGQQMTLGTIIAIVLGIAVLVFLIFGFSKGWGNLWDTISNLGGGDSNVDDVVRGCELACTAQNKYAYCSEVRTVKFGDKISFDPKYKDVKEIKENCSVLSKSPYAEKVGVSVCPGLAC